MENKMSYQMNVFAPTEEIKGRRVLPANTESYSGVADSSVPDSAPLLPGDPVKIVAGTKGLPHFAKAAVGDTIMGFVEWNVIRPSYSAGTLLQVSPATNVMYMEAADALDAGVGVNISNLATVTIAKAAAGKSVIGYTLESATVAGQLVRVKIGEPVVLTANA